MNVIELLKDNRTATLRSKVRKVRVNGTEIPVRSAIVEFPEGEDALVTIVISGDVTIGTEVDPESNDE